MHGAILLSQQRDEERNNKMHLDNCGFSQTVLGVTSERVAQILPCEAKTCHDLLLTSGNVWAVPLKSVEHQIMPP